VKTIAVVFYQTPWFHAVLIVLAAIVVARIVDALLSRRDSAMARLLGKEPHSAGRTRFIMIRRLTQATILFVGVALALNQFAVVGTLARAMLASVAIFAAIIGIAARAPLANLVSGVMIAFSQPVRLGDYISVDDVYGTVEEISLTYTFIRTHDNRRVVIPNEAFASKVVNNFSMGSPGSMVEVVFAVPLTVDLGEARAAALEVADRLAPSPEGTANSVDVRELGADGATLVVSAWAAEPLGRRLLASDLRAAIVERLIRDGLIGAASRADEQAAEDRPG
jgi:small-conductance mechanosensitive channel